MLHAKPQIERRQHKRFRAKNLMVTVQQRTKTKIGQVVNISRGGMAVRYVDEGDLLMDAKEVSIMKNSDFFLTEVPVDVVMDLRYNDDEQFSTVIERQSCMKFGDLTPEQLDRLDYLIMKHCWGEA